MHALNPFTEHSFDSGALTLNYAEGPAAGPPLVMLHGATGRWQMWREFFPALLPGWHLYALDLRGHGRSGHATPDGYTIDHYAQDVAGFLQRQVRQPAVLLGHSLGSLTALMTAARVPELVRGLVLHDPPLYLWRASVQIDPVVTYFTWAVQTLRGAASDADLEQRIREKLREWTPNPSEEMVRSWAASLAPVDPALLETILDDRLVTGSDLPDALQKIRAPVTFIQADALAGAAMLDEDAALVRQHCPQALVVKCPGASHNIQDVRPIVLQHVQSLRG